MSDQQLPSDLEVLDKARNALSSARDWLASDTADAIAGRRALATAEFMNDALVDIAHAKGAIDRAKERVYRQAVRR